MPYDPNNPFLGFLEGNDQGARANYFGRVPQTFGLGQQQQIGTLFEPTFNRYLGMLGQQIMGGGAPTMKFTDYLSQNFNPQRELARFSQRDRGGPSSWYFGR